MALVITLCLLLQLFVLTLQHNERSFRTPYQPTFKPLPRQNLRKSETGQFYPSEIKQWINYASRKDKCVHVCVHTFWCCAETWLMFAACQTLAHTCLPLLLDILLIFMHSKYLESQHPPKSLDSVHYSKLWPSSSCPLFRVIVTLL